MIDPKHMFEIAKICESAGLTISEIGPDKFGVDESRMVANLDLKGERFARLAYDTSRPGRPQWRAAMSEASRCTADMPIRALAAAAEGEARFVAREIERLQAKMSTLNLLIALAPDPTP